MGRLRESLRELRKKPDTRHFQDGEGKWRQVHLLQFRHGEAPHLQPDVYAHELDEADDGDKADAYPWFTYGVLNAPETWDLANLWVSLIDEVVKAPNCAVIVTQKHATDDLSGGAISTVVAYAWTTMEDESDFSTSAMLRGAQAVVAGMDRAQTMAAAWRTARGVGGREGCAKKIESNINDQVLNWAKPLIAGELGNIGPAGKFAQGPMHKLFMQSRARASRAGWLCFWAVQVDSSPISIGKFDRDSPMPATAVVFGHASPSKAAGVGWCPRTEAFWKNLVSQALFVYGKAREAAELGDAGRVWAVVKFEKAS